MEAILLNEQSHTHKEKNSMLSLWKLKEVELKVE
jgi:hypothetical protein